MGPPYNFYRDSNDNNGIKLTKEEFNFPNVILYNQPKGSSLKYNGMVRNIYTTKCWSTIQQEVKVDNITSNKILIVDDNEFIRETISKIISRQYSPIEIDFAKDGEVAIQKFKLTAKGGQHYTIIFMDIIMPNMDGVAATQEIRKYEKNHNLDRTPIFGLSAPGSVNQLDECKMSGMDNLLYKPIAHDSLCQVLKTKIG